jgi:predicted O-methyltransferase YrrM
MSMNTLSLTPQLLDYIFKNSINEHPVLVECREMTAKMSAGKMQISAVQGQFMQLLVRLLSVKKALEIGVFTGYSSLCVALALPETGQLIACDSNVEWTRTAKKLWEKAGVANKIDLRVAPALETLTALLTTEANAFDFIFIDADKKNYAAYYDLSFKLLRPGGLIAIDNTLWSGQVADMTFQDENTEILRNLNTKIYADQHVEISLLPIGDGLTLIRKK